MSPIKKVTATAGPFRGMLTRRQDGELPADLVSYAENMLPIDPVNGGPYFSRPGRERLGTAAITAGSVLWLGHWYTPAGTLLNVALVSPAANQMEIQTWSGTAWSAVVSNANFATAGISTTGRARPQYVAPFNGKLIFGDPGNIPWSWDGTSGAGGLASLSNAGTIQYGPTVYYGKCFFVKAADQTTIIWSEENAENTGYEAGGFSNAWTLSQTGQRPLRGIVGMNDALYYFRGQGIGAIRGAVTPDFATSGTHDAISETLGVSKPASICQVGDEIWFLDWEGRPHYLPPGGKPVDISPWSWRTVTSDTKVTIDLEPFTVTNAGAGRHIMVQPEPGQVGYRTISIPANAVFPYDMVMFTFRDSTASEARYGLLYSVVTHQPLGWWTFPDIGNQLLVTGIFVNASTGIYSLAIADTNGVVYRLDPYKATLRFGTDHNLSASAVPYDAIIVGPKHFSNQRINVLADLLHLVVDYPIGVGVGVRRFTSQQPKSANAPAALTLPAHSGTEEPLASATPTRVQVGLRAFGRWVAPSISFSATGAQSFALDSYTLEAFPLDTGTGS